MSSRREEAMETHGHTQGLKEDRGRDRSVTATSQGKPERRLSVETGCPVNILRLDNWLPELA